MLEKNKIENVWFIEDNKLKNANKIVTKINYKGQEIAILKSKRNWSYAELLIKDNTNTYWELNIAPISFKNFVDASFNIANGFTPKNRDNEYCEDIIKALSNLDLKQFFNKMIEKKSYFNMCQLKYIEKHFPEIYTEAEKCRNNFLESYKIEAEQEKIKRQKAEQEQVDITNEIFEDKLKNIKQKINMDEEIQIEDLNFYKDNKYENGKTTQNCILYLAKQYGINIPIATQGFINKRLVSYDFGNGTFAYKITNKNKKASEVMHKYMIDISKCVKAEFKDNIKQLKTQLKEMNGGVK